MSTIQLIAATLLAVSAPGMKPKAILAAVREKHPEASKKDIVRAAFYALTDTTNTRQEAALHLQEFAIGERALSDDEEQVPERPRKKLKAKPKRSSHAKGSKQAE